MPRHPEIVVVEQSVPAMVTAADVEMQKQGWQKLQIREFFAAVQEGMSAAAKRRIVTEWITVTSKEP